MIKDLGTEIVNPALTISPLSEDKEAGTSTYRATSITSQGKVVTAETTIAFGQKTTQRNVYQYREEDKLPTEDIEIIKKCIDWYFKDDMTNGVVNLMVDLSTSDIINRCGDPAIKAFYDQWLQDVKIQDVQEMFFLDLIRAGNLYMFKERSVYKPDFSGRKRVGSVIETDDNTAQAAKKYRWSKKAIPVNFYTLDPTTVLVEGPLAFPRALQLTYVPDTTTISMVKSPTAEVKNIVSQYFPKDLADKIRNNKKLILTQEEVDRITLKKQSYERYARPYTSAALAALRYKSKLEDMDLSTINGFINQLVLVKVGTDKYPATQGQIQKIAELLKTASKSYTLVWNHAIDISFLKPDIGVLSEEKYNPVNQRIMWAYGISKVLMDGVGDTTTGYLNVKGFVERINFLQGKFIFWLENIYKEIATAMEFSEYPEPHMPPLSLTDEKERFRIKERMYQWGVLSPQTFSEEFGQNFNTEMVNKKGIPEEDKQFLIPMESPFQKSKQGGKAPNDGGRPAGSPGDYPKREIKTDNIVAESDPLEDLEKPNGPTI